jgi:NADH:ubiquinone reductase (non-electrogenic)
MITVSTDARKLVVLGTGFAAFNLVKHLNGGYDITVISPRNHFLFTPLLPSTTVGTIEFRSIIEPIRHARRNVRFYHAYAQRLGIQERMVFCRGVADSREFSVAYDILIIAIGAVSNTFRVPGVKEHALFLKELHDARNLRQQIITCFEQANLPSTTAEERTRLLHFVVCGGGPTGVEFAAELNDFLEEDLLRSYPLLVAEARITLVEASREILGSFDEKLRRYATNIFRRKQIAVLTESPVVKVDTHTMYLKDGSQLQYGLLLWSTGNGPTEFAEFVDLPKDKGSRIMIDHYFHVQGFDDIYAMGDCSTLTDAPLPATAQVAQQQGKYLAKALTNRARGKTVEPFRYRHLGMLAYVGGNRALADFQSYKGRGWTTWLLWRSAYLSKIVSVKNKVLVLFDWVKAQIFGRDISQF